MLTFKKIFTNLKNKLKIKKSTFKTIKTYIKEFFMIFFNFLVY